MLRAARLITTLLMMVVSPVALAQKSSGYMDLDDWSRAYGLQLAVFRVMISKTEAICPQQTGLLQIKPNGGVTEILAVLQGGRDWRMDQTAAPDDFTNRRRVATDSCRIDIDITQQQKRDGEWMPLLAASRPNAISDDRGRKVGDPPLLSDAEARAFERHLRVRAHAGNLLQGWISTMKGGVGFEGSKDCFNAMGTFQIDQSGVMLLFPGGLDGDLNRFFVERVDVGADRSTLYLSRGSCRVGFTISASILREGSWVPLSIAPPRPKLH